MTAAENSPGAPVMEVRGLVVERGRRRVLEIDRFAVNPHETVAVVGPNGAGKSTLLLGLARLLRLTEGSIFLHGRPVSARDALGLRRRIGLVLPSPVLLDTSVRKNVAAGLNFRGVRGRQADRRVDEWLDRLGILALRDRHARGLSSGESQRVSLARAFVLEPELLLMDEPFASVDVAARAQLITDTGRLLAETSCGCVLVTHDLEEAGQLGNRLAVIIEGRLRQDDEVARVLAAPADPEVAAFVGVETRLGGRIVSMSDGLAQVDLGGVAIDVVSDLPTGSRVLCCLRPEDITVRPLRASDPPTPVASARNHLIGRVVQITHKGPLAHVTVDCGPALVAHVTADSGPALVAHVTRASEVQLGLHEGMSVAASFKATAVHLIALQP